MVRLLTEGNDSEKTMGSDELDNVAPRGGSRSNPHDRLFKKEFSNLEEAEGLIRETVPAEALKRVDFGSFRIEKDSFVKPELREWFSDLLFSAGLKGEDEGVRFYFLFEHKAHKYQFTTLQMLS